MVLDRKPEQNEELDFLVGTWKLDVKASVTGLPSESQMVGMIYPIHDGIWYQWDIQSLRRAGRITWICGWNPSKSNFQVYFYDNHGVHGHESSAGPGWEDDRLRFTGTMYLPEGEVPVIDEFTRIDEDCFHDDVQIQVGDEWKQILHAECHRLIV